MSRRYLWKFYCPLEGQYVTTISETQPTVCPNDSTPLDSNNTSIIESIFVDIISDGYVSIDSALADNQALRISASDANGGIDINSGFGGITVDTTNSISLDAQAASNFTTTAGNLILEAVAGIVNIDGGSGINVGNNATTTPILIGSSANSKSVTIGNNTGSTALALRSGTGRIVLNSADTTSTAIQAYSSGGINLESVGLMRLASGDSTTSAITLDASSAGGGIVLTSGAQGIFLTSNSGPIGIGSWSGGDISLGTASVARAISVGNSTGSTSVVVNSGSGGIILSSNGGPIGIGSWSGGDMYLGTAAVSRTIELGNTTGTTSLAIRSGTGGIAIGNDANTGEIQLGNVSNAKTITIGNSTVNSRLFNRFGTGGYIKHQSDHTSLADTSVTLTIADILKTIFTITPTVDQTLTLPTAVNAIAGISGVQIGDSIDFIIINNSTHTDETFVIVAPNTGVTIIGNDRVAPTQNLAGTYFTSGSGTYRIRFTNVSSGTEAYTIYRIF